MEDTKSKTATRSVNLHSPKEGTDYGDALLKSKKKKDKQTRGLKQSEDRSGVCNMCTVMEDSVWSEGGGKRGRMC